MSALKFSQIQDMFILLSKKVNGLETAMKDLGAAVSDMSGKVDELEEKEAEREEKEKEAASTYTGTWNSDDNNTVDGTHAEGSIVLMEVNTDTPTDDNTGPLTDDEPVVGATTYTLKIKEIPKLTYKAPASGGDPAYTFSFILTDPVEFDPKDNTWANGKTIDANITASGSTTPTTAKFTFTYVPSNEATFGTITLTPPTGTTIAADSTVEFTVPDGGFIIEGIEKKPASA